jgi:hypothetical protein
VTDPKKSCRVEFEKKIMPVCGERKNSCNYMKCTEKSLYSLYTIQEEKQIEIAFEMRAGIFLLHPHLE